MSDIQLPPPMDASASGILKAGDITIYSLGEQRFVIVISQRLSQEISMRNVFDSFMKTFTDAFGEKIFIVQTENGDSAWQALEKSEDVRRMIRGMVLEEMARALGETSKA